MFKLNEPIVAIFDSGVGGISVLRALIEKFKNGNYIYFADNLYMPYGDKEKSFILERVNNIIHLLKTSYHVDKIIIACNTASSVVKHELEMKKTNEYKDVVIMEFDENYTYLATPQTKKNLTNISVVADRTLAKKIEDNILDKVKIKKIIHKHIKKYQLDKMKTFVLGCTHYELVYEYFKEFCPNSNIILNSKLMLEKLYFSYDKDKYKNQTKNRLNFEINVHFILTKESFEYLNKLNQLIDR